MREVMSDLTTRLRNLDRVGYEPLTGAIGEEAAATIEALNVRVARLVAAGKNLADNHYADYVHEMRMLILLNENDNQRWLMKHDAGVLDSAADILSEISAGERWAIYELHRMASELRQNNGGE
jgi:hypothetical protein